MKKLSLFMLMAVGLLISGNVRAAGDKNDAPQDAVCKIGDQYYSTFANAIAAVPTTGVETVVELIQNCTANGVEIASKKNVTLNCNLFTLTNSNKNKNDESSGSNFPVLKVSGTLTLNGSANVDNTIVGGIDGVNYGVMTVESASAQITINSGKYQAHDNIAIIVINQDANLVINGGEFIGGSRGRYGSVIYNQSNNPQITINGGKFDANTTKFDSGISQGSSLIVTRGNGTKVEINDGEFTIQYSGSNSDVPWVNACVDVRGAGFYEGAAELFINGGSFKNLTAEDKANNNALTIFAYETTKTVVIKGGTFESNGDVAHIKANNTDVKDAPAIQNASFISKNGIALKFCSYSNGETYNINGGNYEGTHGIVVFGTTSATVNINDCRIDATTCGIQCQGLSVVNVVGGSIESDGKGVEYYQGNYTTADGTINIGGSASIKAGTYGVYNDKGTINVTGGRIWGVTNSVFNTKYSECPDLQGIVEVTGGVFNNRPVPEGYDVREEMSASAPKRAAMGNPIPPSPEPPSPEPPHPGPSCDKTTVPDEGNATILGIGLDVIDNPDETTKEAYPYTVGRPTAAIITVNTGQGATTDWATNTTWTDEESKNVVPTIKDDVTIPAGKSVVVGESGHTDAVAGTVTITGTNESNQGNLRVRTGNSLTVGELLTVGSPENQYGQAVVEAGGRLIVGNASDQMIPNIILQDDGINGTGVMLFNPETTDLGNVQATIELRTNAHKISEGNYFWNYIGIPLKTDNFKADNWEKIPVTEGQLTGSYLQIWDFTEGWVNKGLEAFKPFQGVAITNDSKDGVIYRFKGTMVGNADKEMNFKPRGYNFFANSYTAPIDIETLLNELRDNGVVEAVVYMFDTENNRFADVSLGAFSNFHDPYFRVIPSMNGFFILNNKTQTSQQTMDYGDAVYNCALGNRPIFAPKHEAMNFSRVHINVEAEGSKDGVYLIENDEFTSEFENGYDVVKYMTKGQYNIYAQTTAGRQSELFNSNIEGTMIGFEAAANQTLYTLSFDEVQGDNFVLTDMVTGESVEMSEGNTYTFFAEAGQSNDNRFLVTRANKVPTTIGGLKNNAKAQGIYSVMGHYFGNVTEWNRLPQGVYMVNGVKVVKY